MQAREESAVLERLPDERVDILLEGQVDADAHGMPALARALRPLVRGLHQPRPAARDDFAPQLRECPGDPFGLFISEGSGFGSGRAEDGHAVTFAPGGLQTR